MRVSSVACVWLVLAVTGASPVSAEEPNAAAPAATEAVSPPAPAANTPADTAQTMPAAAPAVPPAELPLGADVRERLAKVKSDVRPEEQTDADGAAAFYSERQDEPLWVSKTGWTERAEAVIGELKKADEWGLKASDFTIPTLTVPAGGEASRADLAAAETVLTMTVLRYARYARGGRITEPSKQLSSYLDRTPQLRDPKAVLSEIATSGTPASALSGLNPRHPQFERLRQKYLEMTRAAGTSEIVEIPKGPKLMPGDKNPQVALLRKRLDVATPDGGDAETYDPALVEAVKKFQTEKGTRPDGIVGSGTRAALNDIERPNPDKLLANMEEWRWMPDDLGAFYVTVNVPEFMVRVVKDGTVIHEERVVTGEPSKQTPIFSHELETITFHPRWIVPDSIKVLELYPSLARGGASLQRQGLKLMYNGREVNPAGVDWGTADIRAFDVYQPSGPSNVLGVVKFSFPNKHGVYMHDTSSKSLFEEPSRPFSHGCMRVRDPLRLAEILLSKDQGWDRARIDEIVNGPTDELPVQLQTKIPVHVTYFTETIDDAGNEHLFKDVYGHEQRIKLALAGKWNQIDVGPDHLAPVRLVRQPYSDPADPFSFFFGSYGNSSSYGTYSSYGNKPGKKAKSKSASGGVFNILGF